MESHSGEVQGLPPTAPPPPPQNTGDEPLTTEETKKHYHNGCPGCQLEEANQTRTGIPYLNFFYIWIICLTSTLPIQSLFPYLYFMIRDMKIAKQEEDIGFYAGFVGASYFIGRTFSSVPWGIFADKYGRKPCIVISILSVIVFNTLFGLSTRYWMAIVTRGLLGMLCGILGPIKAYATEVCRKEHQALGMSLVTTSRAIAFVVGPAIGGFLAQPAEKYQHIFSKESIFGRFPYFLPCFIISILATGSCIASIWLPETLHFHNDGKGGGADEEEAQMCDLNLEVGEAKQSSDTSMKNLLKNWELMSAVIIYCIFSLHDVAYIESFSLWAVSKRKFRGLSLTSQDVGIVLGISGIGVLLYQFVVYPVIAKYFGPIRPLRPAAILSILLLTVYPFMANLQGPELKVLINIASILKNVFSATITTACNILQNTAVTQKQRGVANGISVTLMSLFKGVAPAGAGILFSWTQKHVTGLFLPGNQILFLVISMVAVIGLILTFKPFFSMSNALKRS
ncbi:protein ZINC INDUCED FACILITATOR-LIKE 1-like isoform X1 [Miscanthus floridulus]|uniref:protein ZINC INDUCED FACILITATOR-LIKE 1-like isoform X1 n=1 Tax=Miscanthus floridulus TaxID=154761 RepID=UPI00345AA061